MGCVLLRGSRQRFNEPESDGDDVCVMRGHETTLKGRGVASYVRSTCRELAVSLLLACASGRAPATQGLAPLLTACHIWEGPSP